MGRSVIAPMDGTVILVDQHFYSGKFIILDHGGGLFTSYSHLNKWLVEEGETVLKAEKIGEVAQQVELQDHTCTGLFTKYK